MVRVLRLVSADYRALESRLQEAHDRNKALEFQLEGANAESASQCGIASAAEDRIEDLKRMVDALSFRCDRRYIFARNETPAAAPPVPPVQRRRFARDVVNERTAAARAQLQQMQQEPNADDEIAGLRREAGELIASVTDDSE